MAVAPPPVRTGVVLVTVEVSVAPASLSVNVSEANEIFFLGRGGFQPTGPPAQVLGNYTISNRQFART